MSTPRGAKHARAVSSVSREPKRIRDDETVLSDMSIDPWTVPGRESSRLTRKRRDVNDPDEAAETTSSEQEDDSTTEAGNEEETQDDEAWLARQAKRNDGEIKGKGKVARTPYVDSPSKRKRRLKGSKDPFIISPPGSKARGKRVLDDSEDHEVGDEWTDLNGLRWRMGEDGEVRREAVVVEMRLKYPNMPKDSRHPDAKVKVPVLVEKFLTEHEYEAMRIKKLLGFQEEERQREIDEAEAKRRKKQEEEEAEMRARAAQSGRLITTPKKVRNVQALFGSPLRQSSSPLRGVLPVTLTRSRSFSGSSAKPPSQSSPPSVPYKRLSLSMGSTSSPPASPAARLTALSAPSSASKVPAMASATSTPRKASQSLRVPLSSPSQSSTPVSPFKRALGSLSDIVARRKREESLLRLLRDEADRRKKREASVK